MLFYKSRLRSPSFNETLKLNQNALRFLYEFQEELESNKLPENKSLLNSISNSIKDLENILCDKQDLK